MHFASYYRWLVVTQHWGMPTRFDSAVLDVGADDGEFLAQIQAPQKIGLDLMHRAKDGFSWVQADAVRLPFAAEKLGNILAFDVIEHVHDNRAWLSGMVHTLRPGVTLWLSTTAHRAFVFPGGRIQARLEKSWGHVRRGYTEEMLRQRLPNNVEMHITWWNEPAMRIVYVLLVFLNRKAPRLAQSFVRQLVAWNARAANGQAGHLFARVIKTQGGGQ